VVRHHLEAESLIEPRLPAIDKQNANGQHNIYPADSSVLQELLQDSAENLRENTDCAAVLFLLGLDDRLLSLAACALDMPVTDYPAVFQAGRHKAKTNGQVSEAAIKLNQRSARRSLAAKAFPSSDHGTAYLTTDCLHEALRPLLSRSEAARLQHQLDIQQIAALPLCSGDKRPLGVMLVAFTRSVNLVDFDYLTAISQQVTVALYHQRHRDAMTVLERIVLTMQSRMASETEVLQTIVDAVVHDLGYAGAMVATLEDGRALPVRAYSIDVNQSLIQALEKRAGQSLISDESVVYLDDAQHKDNLSVRAVHHHKVGSKRFLLSDHLHDLLRPFVNKPLCDFMQRLLSIKQVLALPFFWEEQVVGNMFVLSRQATFTPDELLILTSFGQQAAAGLRNARMYRRAEEQRQIAEKFGRMAFGATASIHKLRNQIGAARTYLYLLESVSDLPAEQLHELLADVSLISGRLDQAADLLDSLHQPWRHIPDEPVNVNYCLLRALGELFPLTSFKPINAQIKTEADILVSLSLSSKMPMVETTADMLSEAFRIIIKNGVEALAGCPVHKRKLYVQSQWVADEGVIVTIRDDGKGIRPVHLNKIFDLGWSTKDGQGMGFGLFWTKDYMEGLGGSIEVESAVDAGTTFTLILPATISWEQQTAKLGETQAEAH
jgi:signal transduction histidine kinase